MARNEQAAVVNEQLPKYRPHIHGPDVMADQGTISNTDNQISSDSRFNISVSVETFIHADGTLSLRVKATWIPPEWSLSSPEDGFLQKLTWARESFHGNSKYPGCTLAARPYHAQIIGSYQSQVGTVVKHNG